MPPSGQLLVWAMHQGRAYVALDIETTGLWDTDRDEAPDVLCAVTMVIERVGPGMLRCAPAMHWSGAAGEPMQQAAIDGLVRYLARESKQGRPSLTWNGAGFDFRVLCARCSHGVVREQCMAATKAHVDPMFTFFCTQGFPVALDSVAHAAGTMRKSGSGADAAAEWAKGTARSQRAVLAYCERDVAVLVAAVAHCDATGCIPWVTKRAGKVRRSMPLPVWQTVAASAALPELDNSWMGEGRPRRVGFVGWSE